MNVCDQGSLMERADGVLRAIHTGHQRAVRIGRERHRGWQWPARRNSTSRARGVHAADDGREPGMLAESGPWRRNTWYSPRETPGEINFSEAATG